MQKENISINNRFLSLQDLQVEEEPDDNVKSHKAPLKSNISNKKLVDPKKGQKVLCL